jgi:hypothetical protein
MVDSVETAGGYIGARSHLDGSRIEAGQQMTVKTFLHRVNHVLDADLSPLFTRPLSPRVKGFLLAALVFMIVGQIMSCGR